MGKALLGYSQEPLKVRRGNFQTKLAKKTKASGEPSAELNLASGITVTTAARLKSNSPESRLYRSSGKGFLPVMRRAERE